MEKETLFKEIIIEGNSIEEALLLANIQIPEGYYILSKTILSEHKKISKEFVAETEEIATSNRLDVINSFLMFH